MWQADRQLRGTDSCEDSSAGRQRLGHISKQGNALLRFLLGEARKQRRVRIQTGGVGISTWRCVGKRALRKWRWEANWGFGCTGCGEVNGTISSFEFGSYAGKLVTGHGVN